MDEDSVHYTLDEKETFKLTLKILNYLKYGHENAVQLRELKRKLFLRDDRKIRLPGHRAHGGEFGAIEVDPIAALAELVGKGLQHGRGRLVGIADFRTAEQSELLLRLLAGHVRIVEDFAGHGTIFPFAASLLKFARATTRW